MDEEIQQANLEELQRKKEAADHEEASPRSASQISDTDTQLRPPAAESPRSIRRRVAIATPMAAPTVCEVTSFDREGNASLNYRELDFSDDVGKAMPTRRRNKLFPHRRHLPAVWTETGQLSSNYAWGKLTTPSKEVSQNMCHTATKGKGKLFFSQTIPAAKLRWHPARVWAKITAGKTG